MPQEEINIFEIPSPLKKKDDHLICFKIALRS